MFNGRGKVRSITQKKLELRLNPVHGQREYIAQVGLKRMSRSFLDRALGHDANQLKIINRTLSK